MPRFDDNAGGEIVKYNAGRFGFSAVRIADLSAAEYTLATLVIDVSGSTKGFTQLLEDAANKVVEACKGSQKPDNIMLRVVVFSDNTTEIMHWTEVMNVEDGFFTGKLGPVRDTALYDAVINGAEGTFNFATELRKQDYDCNGILFVLTDGCENYSKFVHQDPDHPAKYVKDALTACVRSEKLNNMLTVLIAINTDDGFVKRELDKFNAEVGFNHFVEASQATADALKKIAKFVSDSISSQSQVIVSKTPSQIIPPSI